MDSRGVKRPRSGTPEGSNKKKDKSKKKKKSKPNAKKPTIENNAEDNTNSLESTATADGQYMAKILSTFSKMEQSRFEAFKRVSFPSNAIRQYVAYCLAERLQPQPQQQHHHHATSNANSSRAFVTNPDAPPQLHDLVVPGQEEEITTVVATLAKAYAQRLCAAAKAQQQLQQSQNNHQQQQQSSSSSSSVGPSTPAGTATATASTTENHTAAAIQPHHVLQAFYARQQQGQDPGFFLQPNSGITIPSASSNHDAKEQMKRVAALAAQEEFDRVLEDYKELYQKHQQNPQKKQQQQQQQQQQKESTPKPMDVDDDESDSGDEEEVELDMEKELEKEMLS